MKRFGVLLAMCLVLGSTSLFGQGVQTGTLRGVVQDDQRLPVPGATVTIQSPALQGLRSITTDASGLYTFRALPPGEYQITVEIAAFDTITAKTTVPLGLDAETNITLKITGAKEFVHVVGSLPAPIIAPAVGATFKRDEIEALPMARHLAAIAELSPGLTNITPNASQVSISGAFAFDNIFMVNGVDVDDNLFGSPQNLFIEDAIQEVQTLTSGMSAEYGRFSGGVVNAITKSGGDTFSGSLRTNLSNPSWSTVTPFEAARNVTHSDVLNHSYEGTLGGPIVSNRVWFFSAGRWEDTTSSLALPITGYPNTQVDKNRRGEIKVTATPAASQMFSGGYLNNFTDTLSRPSIPQYSIDQFSVAPASLPNWFAFGNYRGVIGAKALAEVQYSERTWTRQAGGTSKSVVESPFMALSLPAQYNAPYFDAADPEGRNNRQLAGNFTYFMDAAGRHELKSGYEWFRSQRTGGNSQTATDRVFHADFATDDNGDPLYDATGHLIPMFEPDNTFDELYFPDRNSVLNVDTHSLYAQDHWTISSRLTADLGVRFEKASSKDSRGIAGVDTHTIVPRLAAAYDLKGNGKLIAHTTYSHYSGRYNEAQIGINSNVGNPDELYRVYVGPAGQGRNFAAGFDPANYVTVGGFFPTANVSIAPGLSSPVTKEFTASLGADAGKGYVEGTYVIRRTSNLIEDSISLANGMTTVVRDGEDFGTFTNVVLENSPVARREYQGLLFLSRYNVKSNWSVNGHYTLMMKNDGNYEGEASNAPGQLSLIGDYPEAFNEARNYPMGRLQGFQRHKVRVWSTYTMSSPRFGQMSVSGMVRMNSGQVYSLKSTLPLTAVQESLIAAYPDAPSSQVVYYGARGSETFKGYGLFDTSVNYNIPVFRSMRPWVKLDVFNLLNNQKQIGWNTTVTPDPNSPKDSLGLPTGYLNGVNFGKADNNNQFPSPLAGVNGGRTIRVAFGFRF